jgi:hypothetical protein
MQALKVKHFSQTLLKQKFGDDYRIYAKRDLIRMRGPFVQSVILGIGRSGSLSVIPTFYVVGADPSDEVMFQTMSLPLSGVDRKRKWLVLKDAPLDEMLVERLARQLNRDSPLSYFEPFSDEKIHRCLRKFTRKTKHWVPSLALAYWEIMTGAESSMKTLEKARSIFIKFSRYGAGKEPLDYEVKLMERYGVLRERVDSDDGFRKCREEAELHAEKLKLPKIDWPAEWPY